jgi:hypothetical protein
VIRRYLASPHTPSIFYFFLRGSLYRKGRCRNFKGGLFDWKSRVLVPFLRVKSDWRATSPPPPQSFPPNTSDKNFEVAILLKIVRRSYNKNSGVDTSPQGPGAEVVSCALGANMVLLEVMLTKTSEGSFDWKL